MAANCARCRYGASLKDRQQVGSAYAIAYGREWQPLTPSSGATPSMQQRLGSTIDHNWTAFYLETNAMLNTSTSHEHCDCYRRRGEHAKGVKTPIIENRYFVHAPSNVRLTYLEAFHRGEQCHGTWWPGDPDAWRTPHAAFAPRWTIPLPQLVRTLLPVLLAPSIATNTAVVLNLGHWLAMNRTHPRLLPAEFDALGTAANDSLPQGAQFYWSTTTTCPLHRGKPSKSAPACSMQESSCKWSTSRLKHTWCASTWDSTRFEASAARAAGFRVFDSFKSTQLLHDDDYLDGLHLTLPNVCALNLELLHELGFVHRREACAPRRGGRMRNDAARDAFRGPEIKLLMPCVT